MKSGQTAKRDWGVTWFTRGVFDHTAGCSVEVSVNVEITWQSKGTHEGVHYLKVLTLSVCQFVTCPEVAFDNHLVLLLISSCDDQIILRADEPQELLKPAKKRRNGENKRLQKKKLDRSIYSVATNVLPVDLPGLLNGGHSLNLF